MPLSLSLHLCPRSKILGKTTTTLISHPCKEKPKVHEGRGTVSSSTHLTLYHSSVTLKGRFLHLPDGLARYSCARTSHWLLSLEELLFLPQQHLKPSQYHPKVTPTFPQHCLLFWRAGGQGREEDRRTEMGKTIPGSLWRV